MIKQEYSITRTRATWKPRVTSEDLPFFECEGQTFVGVSGTQPASYSGTGRTLVAQPPFLGIEAPDGLHAVQFIELNSVPETVKLDYEFNGGFNNNCLKIFWDISDDVHEIEWVYLKTFTGSQLKYVLPKKKSPLLFAFADEDAFVYCNKMPCDECAFRCKSGFVAYVSIKGAGIIRMPLERISSLHLNKHS